jgi:hypothetical protein
MFEMLQFETLGIPFAGQQVLARARHQWNERCNSGGRDAVTIVHALLVGQGLCILT